MRVQKETVPMKNPLIKFARIKDFIRKVKNLNKS